MRKTTIFGKFTGESVRMNGVPKRIDVFDAKAADADYVNICTFSGYYSKDIYLVKGKNGIWRSPLWFTGEAYMCYELQPKKKNYTLECVHVLEEEAKAFIAESIPNLIHDAEEVIAWCDEKDKADEDGRYWISAYRGTGVYRLIVADGKIQGAIYGGLHDNNCGLHALIAGRIAFTEAIYKVIEKHLNTKDFHLLKADGSGMYFYLRNQEDAIYLNTKEYDVPSATGGYHHNIEVK